MKTTTLKTNFQMEKAKTACTEIHISDGDLKRINPEKQPLTVETLRTFKGMENLSDEQAQELVFSIQNFCAILLEAVKEQEKIEEVNNQYKIAA